MLNSNYLFIFVNNPFDSYLVLELYMIVVLPIEFLKRQMAYIEWDNDLFPSLSLVLLPAIFRWHLCEQEESLYWHCIP